MFRRSLAIGPWVAIKRSASSSTAHRCRLMVRSSAITSCASTTSCRIKASIDRAIALSTMLDIATTAPRRFSRSCIYSTRVIECPPVRPYARTCRDDELTEPAGDVVLCSLIARIREQLLGRCRFDERPHPILTQREEHGLVGHPRSLLHVVRHDDDRVVPLEISHQVLDAQRRNG